MKHVVWIALFIAGSMNAQKLPAEYNLFVKKADSLYRVKDYKSSALFYSAAFKSAGGKGRLNDRYDAACSWALAGNADSAFVNLELIINKGYYYYYDHIRNDKDLFSLHDQPRWNPLLQRVKHNKDSVEAKMDKKLVARLDSLQKEDQKWRNLFTRYNNNQLNKDSIDPKTIGPNMMAADKRHTAEIRKIFYQYGFPNNDLVGTKGASDFWLLVQHQDNHPELQDSILVAMKAEAEKGKASWGNYAYLTDRVKRNTGQKQIYGTQMQLNSDSTSYEPQPVIEPEKLNERRSSAGLNPIEDYIKTMNTRYYGTLKKK